MEQKTDKVTITEPKAPKVKQEGQKNQVQRQDGQSYYDKETKTWVTFFHGHPELH